MFISCDRCGYDSGDQDTMKALAAKVIADGGKMETVEPPQRGWFIACPNGHEGDAIHLD
jgi:hypothetical protein